MAIKKRNKILIAGGILLLVFLVYSVFKGSQPKETKVSLAKVELRTIIETVSANGKIQPEVEVKISPDVAGEIIEMRVAEGDSVKKGDLLLKINPDLQLTALERIKANLNNSKANLANAKARLLQTEARMNEADLSYKRNKGLHQQKVMSDADFEAAQAAWEVARAETAAARESVRASEYLVKSAEANLSEALKNLERTSIFSPIDGVISKLNSEKGERVVGTSQMAGTEIMRIADLGNMEVSVDVSENDIIRIKHGDTASVEVDAYGNRKFKGVVTEIANSASSSGVSSDQVTNFVVKIRILRDSYKDLSEKMGKNKSPFRPGMSATVDIQTSSVKDVLTVPLVSVTTRDKDKDKESRKKGKNEGDEDLVEDKKENPEDDAEKQKVSEVVFRYVDGKAVLTPVKTGIQDRNYIQIIEGLNEKDQVVDGPYNVVSKRLKDGDAVKQVSKSELFDFKK